jgi:3-oxoacyl-[acyl-carrier protein] reductase
METDRMMDRSLNGKVAIVTGAGPGIGRATALAFARDGADVVVAARRTEPLELLAAEIAKETGRRVLGIPCDIMDLDACAALIDRTAAELGRVDVLVNVATSAFLRERVVDFDWSSYSQSVQLNVVGTMKLCGEAAKKMIETGGGSIINIGTLSTTALMAKNGAYSSTKLAMIGMSKTMAREMGRDNIRVNIVTPGFTTGEGLNRLFEQMGVGTGKTGEEMSEQMAATTELNRHVDPEDIAEACLYLGSDRARNVTGVELHVTAGALIV